MTPQIQGKMLIVEQGVVYPYAVSVPSHRLVKDQNVDWDAVAAMTGWCRAHCVDRWTDSCVGLYEFAASADAQAFADTHSDHDPRPEAPMPTVTETALDAAMAAYGVNKSIRADRERLRRAIEAALAVADGEGYQKGLEAAEYNDTGATAP